MLTESTNHTQSQFHKNSLMISAYSYTELSTLKKDNVDCDHQHSKHIENYCVENGLTLVSCNLSAFDSSLHKETLSDTELLNAYLACVKQGIINQNSFLLIESFNQISQNFVSEIYPKLIDLLNLDVVIVTLIDNHKFSKETYQRDHGATLVNSLMTLVKNHEINERRKAKSLQIKTGWQNLRDGTGQHPRKIITSTCPSWLTVQNDEWQTDQTKVNTIKRIFELALAGNGAPIIAKTLRNENRMPLGKYEFEWNADLISKIVSNKIEIDGTQYETVLKIIDMSKAGSTFSEIASTCRAEQIPKLRKFDYGWTANTVSHVLRNKSVIGILETSKISARENYYPSIIEKDIFNSVQQLIDKRNFAPSVKSDGLVGNLFAGLSRCGLCGAKMKTISATKNRKLTIKCEIAYSNKIVQTDGPYKGQVCPADAVQYVEFEKQLMKWFENTVPIKANHYKQNVYLNYSFRDYLVWLILQRTYLTALPGARVFQNTRAILYVD